MGNNRLAEKYLRDAVNYEPTFSLAWSVVVVVVVVVVAAAAAG